MITAMQIRAARAMMGISIEQLATASGLPVATLETLERDETQGEPQALLAVKQALETGGVLFIASGNHDEGGPGVRLKARTGSDAGIRPENLNSANDD
ncbi:MULTISPECIES: helix-turn-helix domain-containing protein [unclassified Rhizobium]|uniref:helix-turn-helix domain-containing protein n=1 Tax=unclassified Rhizobium TaxID=2613769 RepID=UPI001ADA49BC|nr:MULTISPECIES: helix-turn-helix transcriptional regulator [unclassified Rhizobium]MBO9123445.1 helix-turn-helix transcriptional regulator [Rhizobium sp. 16-488-2b]MBO9173977.1 helix-turn-helix transcriptional regulator [Rhizobium sp. 16-488-2a]